MGAEDQPQPQPGQTPARTKRSKIALACTYCRARKSRCDGGQPACSTCENRGAAAYCHYEQGNLKTLRYVSALEARLQQYKQKESMRSKQMVNDRPRGVSCNEPSSKDPAVSLQGVFSINEDSNMHRAERHYVTPDGTTSTSYHTSIVTDAAIIVPSPGDDDSLLADEPSPIAFVQSMLRTSGRSHLPASRIRLENGLPPDRSNISDGPQRPGDIHSGFLPPRPVADGYIHSFWEHVHPIFPILHKPTFTSSYKALWGSEDERASASAQRSRDDPIFLSTMNIVFAIGSQLREEVEVSQRYSIADNFYKRSKNYYSDDFFDSPSLSVVQLLLLTGVYLQSTQYANRCWNIIGSAIRAGHSMNLHVGRTSENKGQLQREMERRVWHICVVMDQQLAVIFGRPTMILGQSNVPLPQMVDDEYLQESTEGCQPSHIHSQMATLIYSTKLFNILHKILDTFYFGDDAIMRRSDKPSWSYRSLQAVLQLNNSLDDFQRSLPQYLVIDNQTGFPKYQTNDAVSFGAKILHFRFLYIRIILLRPILQVITQDNSIRSSSMESLHNDNTLEHGLALEVCALCISTVQTLIAQLYIDMKMSYWTCVSHKIHYAFSCAIVLVAAQLCPVTRKLNMGTQQFQTAWSQCTEIFENYKPHFLSAFHVIKILEILEERLQEPRTQGETASSEQADPMRPVDDPTGHNWNSEWAILDNLLAYEPLGSFHDGGSWSQNAFDGFGW